MLDTLSPEALDLLSRQVTYPLYLVEIGYGPERYLSTIETVTALNQTWAGSGVKVDSSTNWESCAIMIDNYDSSLTRSANSAEWRGATCKVYLGVYQPNSYEEGEYIEKGYIETGYYATDNTTPSEVLETVLLFSGELTSAPSIGAVISFIATRPAMTTTLSPRVRIDKPVFNHIPPEGSVIKWNNDILELVR